MIGAVRETSPAMRAMMLELPGLEEGDDSRLAVRADHDLALDGNISSGVLCVARVEGVLDPDHLALATGNCIGGRCRWCRLAGAKQRGDSQYSKEDEGF